MLQLFPFASLLATAVSVAFIVMLWFSGDLRPRGGVVVVVWFVAAAWCQFVGGSAALSATGLVLQTLLAIGLIARWRLTA
jgi:hypothetical protein